MVKNLLSLAFAGMALIAPSAMSAQVFTRTVPGASAPLQMVKPGALSQLLTRQQAFKNRPAVKPSFGTRADALSMGWGYCSDPYYCVPVDGEIKVAVKMTEDIVARFAGNSITAIEIGNPVDINTKVGDWDYANPVKEGYVWIAESLDGDPIAEGTGKLGDLGFYFSTVQLDEPFELKEAKDLYIGCTLDVPVGMSGYVADGMDVENNYSAYLYSGYNISGGYLVKDDVAWRAVGDWAGNACVRAVIEGDKLPQNELSIAEYSMSSVLTPGMEFPVVLGVINNAANDVSKVTVSMKIGDEAPQTKECEIVVGYDENGNYATGALPYNGYGLVITSFKYDGVGNNIPWTITIPTLNGNADNNSAAQLSGTLLCIKEGFAKTNVIEEATGLWCGYCVFGYAGMEWLRENAPNFIGIAIHGGDVMDVLDDGAYTPFAGYISGFPSAFLNRDWLNDVYPSPDGFQEAVEFYGNIPAMAEIEAKIEKLDESGSKIRLSTVRRFSFDEKNVNYGVGYTVIEDNVGPYPQTNYLSETGQDAYGFENMPDPVRLTFNEVARNCSSPLSVDGSELTETQAGKDYEFSTEIDLDGYVGDLSNYRVIAYVINGINGAIENACEVSPSTSGVGGIQSSKLTPIACGGKGCINVLSAGDISVLALDGRTVARKVNNGKVSMAPGVYIVTNGTRSAKVVVR